MQQDVTNAVVTNAVVTRPDGTEIAVSLLGSGPLVLMVHGFPESWFSWRNQLPVIAEAGFTAAAIHVRGYAGSSQPTEIADYTVRSLADDVLAVIDELSDDGAVLIGHDWGAVIVQTVALIHPEKVRGLVTLSVPVMPQATEGPSAIFGRLFSDSFFYWTYFTPPGVAEKLIEADPKRFLTLFYYWMSGDRPSDENVLVRPLGSTTPLDHLTEPAPFPPWLSSDELDHYLTDFAKSGFRGPLNRYRAAELDVSEMAQFAERRMTPPTLFIGGERDPSRTIYGEDFYVDALARCDDPRGSHIIRGAGHWIQQEAAEEVNALLVPFLQSVAARRQ